MRIAGILPVSFCNGEGTRFVVFTQGCHHRCPGCHNPDTWDPQGGKEVSVEDLVERYRSYRLVDGLTLSGGDPFYQQEECCRLLDLLGPDVDVWIYTGFLYEEIKDTELARRADVIVDGPFVEGLRCEGYHYGSANQRIIRVDKCKDPVN